MEHLEDGRSDRHAAQQLVQKARAVPDKPGDRRLGLAGRAGRANRAVGVQLTLRSEPDDRRAGAPQGAKAGRKVRTPQGSAPVNRRSGQPEGKWHRKDTASGGGGRGSLERGVGTVFKGIIKKRVPTPL